MKRTHKKSTQQIHIHDGDSIFSRILITKKVSVPIKHVNRDIHNIIKDIIVSAIEDKCIVEGYVKPGSVNIITFSSGILQSHNVSYEVVVQCEVCFPVDGMTLQCITTDTNKAGILAKINNTRFNPITIFVARDHNFNSHIFSLVETGDVITVRVIGQRFELNDKNIWVIAEINSIISKNESPAPTLRNTEHIPLKPIDSSISLPSNTSIQKLPNFINHLKGAESNAYNSVLERIGFFNTPTSLTSNISIGKTDSLSATPQLKYDLSSYLLNGHEITLNIMSLYSTAKLGNSLLCNGRRFHIKSKIVVYTRGGIISVYSIPNHTASLNSSSKLSKEKDDTNEFSWPLNSNSKAECDIKDDVSDNITMSLNKLLYGVASEFHTATPPITSYAAYELFYLDIMFDVNGNAALFSIKDSYTEKENNTMSDYDAKYIINNIISTHFGISSIDQFSTPIWIGHNNPGTLIKHNALLLHGFKLVPLEDTIQISKSQLDELSKTGSNPDVYNNLGAGNKKWDFNELSRLQKDAIKDATILHRQYYHWILMLDGHAIGYVGLRPYDTTSSTSTSQLRYFISHDDKYKRKGFMFSAIALLLEYHASIMFPSNPEIHAVISLDNLPSRGLITKLGFKKTGTKIIKGDTLDVYSRLARKHGINMLTSNESNESHTSV